MRPLTTYILPTPKEQEPTKPPQDNLSNQKKVSRINISRIANVKNKFDWTRFTPLLEYKTLMYLYLVPYVCVLF